MSDLKNKAKNFKNSIVQNGMKTEIRRIQNYIKHKKTVLDEYEEWITLNEPDEKHLEEQKVYKTCLNTKFLIIVPNEEAKENVVNQTYSNYEIKTIKAQEYEENIKNIDADYIIFIDNNVVFMPFTLYEIEKFLEYNECNLIYADNDYLENGKRKYPELKPHYAYDTILSKNYFGNFIILKTKFLKENNEILHDLKEKEYIYDIILRSIEKTNRIMHIDKVLYHKKQEEIQGKTINTTAQIDVIKEHLNRINVQYDSVEEGRFIGQYKINYKIKQNPLISIVIPNMDHIEDLDKAIKSIQKSTYKNYEIIIVENNSKEETLEYYDEISKIYENIKIVKLEISEFNYSKIVNYGVKHSNGEYIVLLNNDIEVITFDWLEQMLMYTQREDVGICGAKLYFPDKSIQHAGVTIGIRGLAGHKYREVNEKDFTSKDSINYVQDLSAVTAACFMVKRSLYNELLGFDEKLAVAFNDVDFCLKVRKAKLLIVYNPFVELYHYESKSRGEDTQSKEKQRRFAKEYELFVKRWKRTIGKGDPYFNINYRLDTDIPTINYNRIKK